MRCLNHCLATNKGAFTSKVKTMASKGVLCPLRMRCLISWRSASSDLDSLRQQRRALRITAASPPMCSTKRTNPLFKTCIAILLVLRLHGGGDPAQKLPQPVLLPAQIQVAQKRFHTCTQAVLHRTALAGYPPFSISAPAHHFPFLVG